MFAPVLFSSISPSLSAGEVHVLIKDWAQDNILISLIKRKTIYHTTVSGQNKDGATCLQVHKGERKHGVKIR